MNELQKFTLKIKNTFDQYPNYAFLNAKTFRGLTNHSLSRKGRMFIRKHNDNGILHKRTYKANEISRTFQN